jgi:small subunit ribosomal protein S4
MSIVKPKKYKIARRLGAGVYEKTQSQKFLLSQAKKAKQQGGRPKRLSDYGLQLIEKQKVRFMYGISEKQFRNYVNKALQTKGDATPAMKLFQLLEARLDNVAYRLGLAPTRGAARQMASHGHFRVNNKRSNVPSQHLKKDDVITIREGSKDSVMFTELDKKMKATNHPKWLNWDGKKMEAQVKGIPAEPEAFLDFQSVLEFYSRT